MTDPKSQRSGIPNETRYHVVFAVVIHLSVCAILRVTLNNEEQCWKVNMSDRFALLTFRHRASCILGQAFRYSPENAFCIFNQQIYLII